MVHSTVQMQWLKSKPMVIHSSGGAFSAQYARARARPAATQALQK